MKHRKIHLGPCAKQQERSLQNPYQRWDNSTVLAEVRKIRWKDEDLVEQESEAENVGYKSVWGFNV